MFLSLSMFPTFRAVDHFPLHTFVVFGSIIGFLK